MRVAESLLPNLRSIRLLLLVSVLCLALPCVSTDGAQQEQNAAVATPAELNQPVELQSDAIQERLEQVKQAEGVEEETRQRLIDDYESALEELNEAEDYASSLAEYREAIQQAPAQIESVQEKLKQSDGEPLPEVPDDATAAELEQKLATVQAELQQARTTAQELEAEQKRRANRRAEIPQLLSEARQNLEEAAEELQQGPAPEANPAVMVARQTHLQAREKKLQTKIEALEAELRSYDVRKDLLPLRRDLAARRLSRAEEVMEFWQERVNEARREEAKQAAEEAERASRAAARAHPVVQELAAKNSELAERRTGPEGLAAKIEEVTQEQRDVDALREQISTEFTRLKEKVEAVGLTKAVGLLLLRKGAELPDVSEYRRSIEQRQEKMSQVQFDWIQLEEIRSELSVLDEEVVQRMQQVDPSLPEWQRESIRREVRKLLETRRKLLDNLIDDYRTYFSKMVDLDNSERQLVERANKFSAYVRERVLWVQNIPALGLQTARRLPEALTDIAAPGEWTETVRMLWEDMRRNPFLPFLLVVVAGMLLWTRRRLRRRISDISDLLHSAATDTFTYTVKTCLYTALIAAPVPLIMLYLGWRLTVAAQMVPGFTLAAGHAFVAAGAYYLVLSLLRGACMPDGLLEDHFRLSDRAVSGVRNQVRWFLPLMVASAFLLVFTEWLGNEAWSESLGRVVFMVCMFGTSVFFAFVLQPSGRFVHDLLRRHRGGWLERTRYLWYGIAVLAPVTLAVIAAFGYYYGAQRLARRFQLTLALVTGIAFINALVIRWLVMARRRIAVQRAEARKAEREGEETTEGDMATGGGGPGDPQESLYTLSVQTRRFLMAFLLVGMGAGLWLIWADVLPALGMLDRVELWSITTTTAAGEVQVPITLGGVLVALVIVVLAVFAARNIPGLLEIAVLQYLPVDRGIRFAVSTLTRYTVIVVGVVLAFGQIGVGWSKVQWLIAAMTVGLGFGLQEIFANFISGLIILFERPMRVGDTVTVGEIFGTVTRIRIRATTIQQWDRKELIVPNKEFITGRLINWTLSDTILRMEFPVGIAYGSNTERAEKLLYRVARENEIVLDEPEPRVVFKEFGDSALIFELRVFIPDMDNYVWVWHQVNKAIDDKFREGGIEIAFPQRDLHLRSVKKPFPVRMQEVEGPPDASS